MTVKEAIRLGPETLDRSLSERTLLFLDTNIWINLAEQNSADAQDCSMLLAEAVSSGRLLCPLAAPILWELHKQNRESALKVAAVMDTLSLSTSFAESDEVHTLEVWRFLQNLLNQRDDRVSPSDVLVPLISYLSSGSSLAFDDSWSAEDRQRCTELWASVLQTVTVSELIRTMDNLPCPERAEPPNFSETLRRRAAFAKGDKTKAWLAEALSVVSSTVLPIIDRLCSRMPSHDQRKLEMATASLPYDRFRSRIVPLLERLPSLLVRAEVMTVSGFDTNRKDTMNDFYDKEILGVPFTYSHAFASEDRWIRHIVHSPPVILTRWPTRLLSTMREVSEFAQDLL